MQTELNGKQYTLNENADGTITLVPVVQDGLCKPRQNNRYWYVAGDGKTESQFWSNDAFDEGRHKAGNCFLTEATAKRAAELMRRSNIFISAALMADPDAGEWAEDRRWSVYQSVSGKFCTAALNAGKESVHVHTQAQAEHMARILKSEGWK